MLVFLSSFLYAVILSDISTLFLTSMLLALFYGMEDMTFYRAALDSKKRIIHTRLFALLIFLLLITSGNKIQSGLREGLLDFAGLACVIISAFGRVWSSIYIAGYKASDLVELGPYSVTRNPLYLFSLIGAAGIGLASGSLLILVLFMLAFGLYYPFVIRREEKELTGWHGPEFLSYIERAPDSCLNCRSTQNPTLTWSKQST